MMISLQSISNIFGKAKINTQSSQLLQEKQCGQIFSSFYRQIFDSDPTFRHKVPFSHLICACALSLFLASEVQAAEFNVQIIDGQTIKSPINRGGPDEWPLRDSLSTQSAISGESSPSAGAIAIGGPNTSQETPPAPPAMDMPAPEIPAAPPSPMTATIDEPQAPEAPVATAPAPTTIPEAPAPSPSVAEVNPDVVPAPAVNELPDDEAEPEDMAAAMAELEKNSSTAQEDLLSTKKAPRVPDPVRDAAEKTEKNALSNAAVDNANIQYVDEQGNPVEAPKDPKQMLAEATSLLQKSNFQPALEILEQLKAMQNIENEMRIDVLYMLSDCIWGLYRNKPLQGYKAIVASTNEALNADINSDNAPGAMLRLGLVNIAVKDVPAAEAEIKALYRRFPTWPQAAQGLTELGYAQMEANMNKGAVWSFSVVLEKYPESNVLERASMGLARALFKERRHNDAQMIMDFVDKRWPRGYLSDPSFILIEADNALALGRKLLARDLYWRYLNLEPKRKGNDALYLVVADMYAKDNDWNAANALFDLIVEEWGTTDSAITAGMRLAEQQMRDEPVTYDEMTPIFARPQDQGIDVTYRELAKRSKEHPAAIISRLKYAMWLLWDKHYAEAMGHAADFVDAYPEHINTKEAKDLIWVAFQKEFANSLNEQNFGRILILWNGFPLVRERYGEIDPVLRNALAQGYLERGDEEKFLELIGDFLRSPKDPQFGEMAFREFFNRYLQAGAWDKILDLAQIVQSWDMQQDLRLQLDYAMALSAQNLNLKDAALSMWKQIAIRQEFPLYQRAYATYFLGRDAAERSDVRAAYNYNRQVLDYFSQLETEQSDKSDPERIKEAIGALMDICEVSNRLPEALRWVERYRVYAPDETHEDYPGLRYREARIYRKLGDTERARALLENIVELFPETPFGKSAAAELRTFNVSRDLQNYLSAGG